MHKALFVLSVMFVLALVLSGCKSEEEEKADWQTYCTAKEFTPKQCELLYAMKQQQSDDAAASSMMSGMAIGVAVGSSSRR